MAFYTYWDDFKPSKSEESPFERLEKASQNEKYNQRYNPNPSPFDMVAHFANPAKKFSYEIVLKSELPAPIFRERNIKYNFHCKSKWFNRHVSDSKFR